MMNGDGPTSRRYDLTGLDVVINEHVRDRFLERLGYQPSHADIRQDACDAIFRGRWSRKKPAFLRGGVPRDRGGFYAWPEDQSYAYIVTFGTPPERIHVTTLLTPELTNHGLREALARWLRANGTEEE
jgi:hypothetical protein